MNDNTKHSTAVGFGIAIGLSVVAAPLLFAAFAYGGWWLLGLIIAVPAGFFAIVGAVIEQSQRGRK